MEKAFLYTEAFTGLVRKAAVGRLNAAAGSVALLDRSSKVRRLTDWAIRGVGVESIPPSLDGTQAAVLVSNYPSVFQSLRAVIKVGCRISTERPRLRAIARPEIVPGS